MWRVIGTYRDDRGGAFSSSTEHSTRGGAVAAFADRIDYADGWGELLWVTESAACWQVKRGTLTYVICQAG